MQVSLQRALQGPALLPRDYSRSRLPLRLSPLPQHFSRVAGRPAWGYVSSRDVRPLPPFALWPAFPASDYYGGSDAVQVSLPDCWEHLFQDSLSRS